MRTGSPEPFWPEVRMCKKVEDCLFSRTGFRVFVVTLLLLILAGVVLNLGYVLPNKQNGQNQGADID